MQPRYVTSMCDRPLLRESLDDDRPNPPTGQGDIIQYGADCFDTSLTSTGLFSCESDRHPIKDYAPDQIRCIAPSTTSFTTGRLIPDDVGSSITSSFFSQSPTPASQNDVETWRGGIIARMQRTCFWTTHSPLPNGLLTMSPGSPSPTSPSDITVYPSRRRVSISCTPCSL
uniref:Uncharacterized protein n=1 Tax=Magallana gigas TaxID=29159 RepID=K1PFH9_MAGGI